MKTKIYILAFTAILFLSSICHAQNYIINLYAGDYYPGFSGDGGKATSAQIWTNAHIATDKTGNLYLPDEFNLRVRKVTRSTGIINTIVGSGKGGTKGDGGLADSSQLIGPYSIAVDDSANIYIAPLNGGTVRKITKATGIINTIAGKPGATKRGDGGPARDANLKGVYSLCLDDSSNLYILTPFGLRKIYKKTGIITTVAGGDTSGRLGSSADGCRADTCLLSLSYGITVDHAGNIYIAETNNNKVRKVTKSTGLLSTVAGTGTAGYSGDGGVATLAELNQPWDVALDKNGNLLISDAYNERLRQVNFKTNGIINTISGNGTCIAYSVSGDGGLADSASCGTGQICVDTFGYIYINTAGSIRILKATTGTVELTKEQLQNKLNLYPNPASTQLFFQLPYTITGNTPLQQVDVYSMQGVLVLSKQVNIDNLATGRLDISLLPAGAYLIKLINGQDIFTQTILITR